MKTKYIEKRKRLTAYTCLRFYFRLPWLWHVRNNKMQNYVKRSFFPADTKSSPTSLALTIRQLLFDIIFTIIPDYLSLFHFIFNSLNVTDATSKHIVCFHSSILLFTVYRVCWYAAVECWMLIWIDLNGVLSSSLFSVVHAQLVGFGVNMDFLIH